MNIVERIHHKYPIEYCMMPPRFLRAFRLTFGEGVAADLQQKIRAGMDRLGLYEDTTGVTFCISAEREGAYQLTADGELLYRFSEKAGRTNFFAYDVSEAIAWVIYILSTNKNWLDDVQKGWCISCRSFCAQQQVASVRFLQCVNAQYRNAIGTDTVDTILKTLTKPTKPFCDAAPVFSARPLKPEAYSNYMGKSVTISLDMLCTEIFYRGSFLAELDTYHAMVKEQELYQSRLQECAEWLAQEAYRQPIMSLGNFFSSLLNRIEQEDPQKPIIDQHEKVKFTLSADGLETAFGHLDKAYHGYITAAIRQDFLRSVCEAARAQVDEDVTAARSAVLQTSRQLQSFCFVNEEAIPEDYRGQQLGWRQLIAPSEADISVNDQLWSPNSWRGMQQHFRESYPPQFWLCSEQLRNLSESAYLPDAARTNAVPISGNQYVWAIWADAQID